MTRRLDDKTTRNGWYQTTFQATLLQEAGTFVLQLVENCLRQAGSGEECLNRSSIVVAYLYR